MNLEQFKRLETEQIEMEKKLNKLEEFIISSDFESLCDFQKSLLIQQLNYMMAYNNVLCVRLRIF